MMIELNELNGGSWKNGALKANTKNMWWRKFLDYRIFSGEVRSRKREKRGEGKKNGNGCDEERERERERERESMRWNN